MGHGGEVWQNVVHWRREWQTISVFLPWEPHEQYEKQKDMTLKDELPRLVGAQYATGDRWQNNSRKNEERDPKQKQHPLVDETGDGSKVWCCKEQYCIGTWNVRSMNQGKLEVVKQEMVRVNIELDYKESWALKNWCFWAVVLDKTIESPLDCKEIKPILKEISHGCSLEGLMLKLKLQYFGTWWCEVSRSNTA